MPSRAFITTQTRQNFLYEQWAAARVKPMPGLSAVVPLRGGLQLREQGGHAHVDPSTAARLSCPPGVSAHRRLGRALVCLSIQSKLNTIRLALGRAGEQTWLWWKNFADTQANAGKWRAVHAILRAKRVGMASRKDGIAARHWRMGV